MSFSAVYPPTGLSGGGVPTYVNLAAFPSAVTAGNGALAIALDTDTLYISNGTIWEPIAGPGAALSVGTFDSGTASPNGAHIDSNALIMQSASATNPGEVNISTQTFAGVKTFSSSPNFSSLTASLPLQLDASKNVISTAIDLTTAEVTGILPISHGGTSQATAAAAFNALSPIVAKGNLIAGTAVNTAGILTVGSDTQVLTADSTQATGLKWAQPTTGTVTSIGIVTPSFLNVAGSPVTTSGNITLSYSGSAIPFASGGTNSTSASSAFNALNPMTTIGDLIYESAANVASRLPVGSTGNVLTVVSGNPAWAPPATSGTVTSIALTVPTFLTVGGSPITSSGTLAVTLSGTALPVLNGGTGTTTSTGTGNVVLSTSPTLVTPVLGAATGTSLSLSGALTVGTTSGGGSFGGNVVSKTANTNSVGIAGTEWANVFSANHVIGLGDATATTTAGTLRGPARTGANVLGVGLTLSAGNGTGTGGSGSLIFQTAPVAASSSTPNVLQTNLSISSAGIVAVGPSVATQTSFSGNLIRGVTDGTAPAAGMIGEIITSGVITTVQGVSNAQTTVTSISLTAGDWNISGILSFAATATTVVANTSVAGVGISKTTNNLAGAFYATSGEASAYFITMAVLTGNSGMVYSTTPIQTRLLLTTTTTVFLIGQTAYAGSAPNFTGSITAERRC